MVIFKIASLSGIIGFIFLLITLAIAVFYTGRNKYLYHKISAIIAFILIFIHAGIMIKFKYFG
jgi:DMSO/TMAO reductase YedYZ heme-binding membrane subunit